MEIRKKKKKKSSTEGRNCGEYTRNFWKILHFKNMHVGCELLHNCCRTCLKSLSEMPGGQGTHFFLDQALTIEQIQQEGPQECFIDIVATQGRALVPQVAGVSIYGSNVQRLSEVGNGNYKFCAGAVITCISGTMTNLIEMQSSAQIQSRSNLYF